MASIFVSNRSKDGDDEELALGTPDLSEAQDLARHVDRCALRYKLFSRRMLAQGQSLMKLERLGYVILAVVILTNPKLWQGLVAIGSFLKIP